MLRALPEDKERIIEILLLAFENNKSVNFICGKCELQYHRITLLMEYAFKVCNKYGKVFISEDKNACAMVLLPQQKRASLTSLLWDIKLALKVIGINNITKVLNREKEIKAQHPSNPFYYLWFIGVHPNKKGRGIGSTLLAELLADAKQMNRPVYLETSTLKNLPWYKRHGFNIYKELSFSYTLYLLNNNALLNG